MARLLVFASLLAITASLPPQNIQPPFFGSYSVVDLGKPAVVPRNYSGLAFKIGDPDAVYLSGGTSGPNSAVYRVPLQRDSRGHVAAFGTPVTKAFDAPNIDGGLQFDGNGAALFTRYRANELGQVKPAAPRWTNRCR